MNKLFLFLTLALLGLSSCRAVIVVPGPGPGRCHVHRERVCHDYVDRRGRWHRECHFERHRRCHLTAQTLGTPIGPVALAQEFGISAAAADKMLDLAMDANTGNYSTAAEMGLGLKDLENMSRFEAPTDKGIEAVATATDSDPEAIRRLFTTILDESKQNQ